MGENITITASDGFTFDAYLARPEGKTKGGLVVIQEIFGFNDHMREVCDGYAAEGYISVGPSLFDRYEKKLELGYSSDDVTRGREIRAHVGWDDPVQDLAAAAKFAAAGGNVGSVGFCWGGSRSFLCATRIDGIAASICYYGGQVLDFKDETANAALMMHFGSADASIPPDAVVDISIAHPDAVVHTYEGALHGFNCDHRASYNKAAAEFALERSLALLDKKGAA